MRHKTVGRVGSGFLLAAGIAWFGMRFHFLTGPTEYKLAYLFLMFYVLAFTAGFLYGCQEIFSTTGNWFGRVAQAAFLLVSMAIVGIGPLIGMSFNP